MKLSQFKFKLPEDRIAQYPVEHRDESRLMVVHKKSDEIEHVLFKDILNYFDEKDVFVFNDTRVFPARMYGNKEKTGACIEYEYVLFIKIVEDVLEQYMFNLIGFLVHDHQS